MSRRRLPETSDEHRGERAAHAIYGSVIVLAVIVAEQGTSASAAQVIASVAGAAVVTALAEVYANYIGGTIRFRRRLSAAERNVVERNVAVGFATAISPIVFFVLAALDVIDLDTAFDVAIWAGVGILGAHAAAANRLAGFPITQSVLFGLAFAALGAALVGLKALT
ncbi:MAG: hypothetical protein E4H22_03745 [Solirubrobacterales bacterium]|nr:MAG: hypothetical protein E4H22_03745 [Solirubrobacterales bacterium]